MIKITFELDEKYIKELRDLKNIMEMEASDSRVAIAKAMFRMVAVTKLLSDIKEGKKEFVIRKEELPEAEKILFEHSIDEVLMLAAKSGKKENKINV